MAFRQPRLTLVLHPLVPFLRLVQKSLLYHLLRGARQTELILLIAHL